MIRVGFLLRGVILLAGPGHEVSAGSQRRVPAWLKEAVVLSLQSESHLELVIELGHVEVVSAVLHQSTPHFGVVFVVTLDNEAGWLQLRGLLVLLSNFLGEGLIFICFLLLQLSFDLSEELSLEENVLIFLLVHGFHLLLVHIWIIVLVRKLPFCTGLVFIHF